MIKEFLEVKVDRQDNTMNVFVDIRFLNQSDNMFDPRVHLTFEDGNFKGSVLVEQDNNSNYRVNEIETLQTLHFLSRLSKEKIHDILFA